LQHEREAGATEVFPDVGATACDDRIQDNIGITACLGRGGQETFHDGFHETFQSGVEPDQSRAGFEPLESLFGVEPVAGVAPDLREREAPGSDELFEVRVGGQFDMMPGGPEAQPHCHERLNIAA
jgi:hypothetical protein